MEDAIQKAVEQLPSASQMITQSMGEGHTTDLTAEDYQKLFKLLVFTIQSFLPDNQSSDPRAANAIHSALTNKFVREGVPVNSDKEGAKKVQEHQQKVETVSKKNKAKKTKGNSDG